MAVDALQSLLPLEEAVLRLRQAAWRPGTQWVALDTLAGRVAAVPVHAPRDLPPFRASALDGFALRAADAGRPAPIAFRVAAGDDPPSLPVGAAAAIATGAPVPEGADAVLAAELAETDGLTVRAAGDAPRIGTGIREAGQDVRAGAVAIPAGQLLGAVAISGLAAAGATGAEVVQRPRVAVLVTGDELVAPGSPVRRGQIYESNSLLVAATLERLGCAVTVAPRVPDRPDATQEALAAALGTCDLVVTTGGVSVGPHDYVKASLDALGVRRLFWRVAIQPGKPVWAGVAPSGAVVVGLPGNPLSALVGLHLLIRPLVAAVHGLEPRPEHAALARSVPRRGARLRAVPIRLRDGSADPVGADDSHLLLHAVAADALALVDAGSGAAPAGLRVPVLRLDGRP